MEDEKSRDEASIEEVDDDDNVDEDSTFIIKSRSTVVTQGIIQSDHKNPPDFRNLELGFYNEKQQRSGSAHLNATQKSNIK